MLFLMMTGLSLAQAQDVPTDSGIAIAKSPVHVVILGPDHYTDFPHKRMDAEESCLAAGEWIVSQGLPREDLFSLCGAEATLTSTIEILSSAAQHTEMLVVFASGHMVDLDLDTMDAEHDIYFVPTDGFNPGAETKESLLADDRMVKVVTDANPDLQNMVWWFDTVHDPMGEYSLTSVLPSSMNGLPPQASVYAAQTSPDTPMRSTLHEGILSCWAMDGKRPYGTESGGAGNRLREGEFESCLENGRADPAMSWSGQTTVRGITIVQRGNVENVLYDFDQKPERSGPVLGRKAWVGVGGYGLAGVSLVAGVLTHGQYTTYSAQLEQLPFQGTPSERAETGRNANSAMMRRNASYAGAASVAVLTTGYLLWQAKQGNEQEVAVGATARPLHFWVAASLAPQQPSTAGFTYRF